MLLLADPKALLVQLKQVSNLNDVLDASAIFIQTWLQCEQIFLSYGEIEIKKGAETDVQATGGPVVAAQNITTPFPSGLSLPLFVGNVKTSPYLTHTLRSELDNRSILSFVVVPIFEAEHIRGFIECHFLRLTHTWPREVCYCFFQIAEQISLAIERVSSSSTTDTSSAHLKLQLFESLFSDQAPCAGCILDTDLKPRAVAGSWSRLIGVELEQFLSDKETRDSILRYEDPNLFSRKIQDISLYARPYATKVTLQHHLAEEMRTIFLKANPKEDPATHALFWEITAHDSSEHLRIEAALASEQKKVRAFFELSRLLEMRMEVAAFCLRALSTLTKTIDGDAGFVCLRDFHMSRMNVVASEALAQNYVDALARVINMPCLVKFSSEHGITIIVNDVQKDERTANDILRIGGMKSALLVPIILDNLVLGTIVVLSRKLHHFTSEHAEFITAYATQIALKVRTRPSQPNTKPVIPITPSMDSASKGEVS